MIPQKIEGQPIHQITVTADQLSEWTNSETGEVNKYVELYSHGDGASIAVPPFCFDASGRVIPKWENNRAVPPKDEWVMEQVRECLAAARDARADQKDFHIHVIRDETLPNHVGLMISEYKCEPRKAAR